MINIEKRLIIISIAIDMYSVHNDCSCLTMFNTSINKTDNHNGKKEVMNMDNLKREFIYASQSSYN